MLPGAWRLQVENDGLGTDVDVEVRVRGISIDSSNLEPSYGSWSSDLGTADLADDSFHETAEQDNTADGYQSVEVEVVLSNFGATPNDDGRVVVYLQGRGEGGSDWPDDGEGYPVLVFDPDATGTFRKTAEV